MKSLTTFFSDGWDLREHLQRRARQAVMSWKFNSEKIISEWVQQEDPKFGTKKFRIRIIWVTAWPKKMTFIGSQSEQAQRERIHLCSELKMKSHFSSRMLCKKLQRNWKNWKVAAIRKEIIKKKKEKIGRISYAAWSGIRNSESILVRSWLTEQLWRSYVLHQAPNTSSSRKLSREVGMPRNTRENMRIPGNVSDRQHARRDPDELRIDSRNLATPSGIPDDVEDSEKRRNWE